eukprot:1182199-Prorocentrum_minimum.AAC.3
MGHARWISGLGPPLPWITLVRPSCVVGSAAEYLYNRSIEYRPGLDTDTWLPVTAFSVAHLIVDLPPLFLQALVNGSICYFVLGYNSDQGRYMFFIIDLFLSFAVAEALCFLVAVVVPSFIVGIAGGAFVYGRILSPRHG